VNARPILVLALGVTLSAFALRTDVRPHDSIDPQLYRVNHERWQSLPTAERDALRERYQRFRSLPPGEQEALDQRSATLRRLRERFALRESREPTAEEAAAELARKVEVSRQRVIKLGATAATTEELLAQMDMRTLRCIAAFLDNLAKDGRLSQQELARLRAQSPPELMRDALLLLKAEQINLYAEGVRPDEADALLPMSPLDVASRAERQRRERGYLGPLGRLVPYTSEDRAALLDLSDPIEFRERLRDRKAAQIRALFISLGQSEERIDALLNGPVNELERTAVDVLGSGGPTALPN
jgi:hypothetical protein